MELFEYCTRLLGTSIALRTKAKRQGVEALSAEKIIPLIFEYSEDGSVSKVSAKEVINSQSYHPYKALSKDFNKERLADNQVFSLFKSLEHFPTLPQLITEKGTFPHPLAELIYSELVYLKPDSKLASTLSKLDFVAKSKALANCLSRVRENIRSIYKINLDLESIPKRDVGKFCLLADSDGYSKSAKFLGFGFHKLFPRDRIVRELSSLKSCEEFVNPTPVPYSIPDNLRPFVSYLKVAIVATKHSMLDSGDLYQSGLDKLACKLVRLNIEPNLAKVPKNSRNFVPKVFRAGIELVQQEIELIDETKIVPGVIRLVFPGGVKVAAQLQQNQAVDSSEEPVDILLDFRAFAAKGALACFAMLDPNLRGEDFASQEDLVEYFNNLKPTFVSLNGVKYPAYVGYLPVLRPGQRYTELSKHSNNITIDLITKAIMKKPFRVKSYLEEEYSELCQFKEALDKEIKIRETTFN